MCIKIDYTFFFLLHSLKKECLASGIEISGIFPPKLPSLSRVYLTDLVPKKT